MIADLQGEVNAAFLSINDERWITLIDKAPLANIFHHPAWSQVLATCYNYYPQIFALVNAQNDLMAGLPLMRLQNFGAKPRWESLPFSDHCFPICENAASETRLITEILAAAREQQIKLVGFRGNQISHEAFYPSQCYAWHSIQLMNDFPAVSARINTMHRRNARNAQERGVQITRGNSQADIDAFYHLHLHERHRQGLPVQPKKFFVQIRKLLFEKDLGSILFAVKDGKAIASILLLHYGQVLTYKFGASDRSSLVFRPNDLLFWTAIQWGCENHYEFFDLGRTDLDNIGLARFKNGWGADEHQLVYYSTSPDRQTRVTEILSRRLKAVIRVSPLWVCRLLGELFYKYAG